MNQNENSEAIKAALRSFLGTGVSRENTVVSSDGIERLQREDMQGKTPHEIAEILKSRSSGRNRESDDSQ